MASEQFLHLLEQIHKISKAKKLDWKPARTGFTTEGAFRVALGEGIVRIEAESEGEWQFKASYRAQLYTREGSLVDEVRASMHESQYFNALLEIYRSAREAAFDLNRLIDGMQDDLETGRSRELPPEDEPNDGIPF